MFLVSLDRMKWDAVDNLAWSIRDLSKLDWYMSKDYKSRYWKFWQGMYGCMNDV